MELWHILAIALGSLFVIIFIAFIIVYARNKSREEERNIQLAKMYADPNLAKMEYDCAVCDEETEQLLTRALGRSSQSASDDEDDQQLSFLGLAETEGIEEITGNYKP